MGLDMQWYIAMGRIHAMSNCRAKIMAEKWSSTHGESQ
jgi:hypothetical protein